jgi:membrane protease subunit HflK
MYLPLDKMAEQGQRTNATGELKMDSSTFRELTNAVTEQLRRDAAATDSRRGVR